MLLAGDVGGTKTLLGLFEATPGRPRARVTRSYPTASYSRFTDILDAFLADAGGAAGIDATAIGVAGPVVGQRAIVTNIGWAVDRDAVLRHLGARACCVLNDLEAMATSVDVLDSSELLTLQDGTPDPSGNAVVMAAGTGFGVSFLHWTNGRRMPISGEAGHTDFSARTEAELALVAMLRQQFGRATLEYVLSGQGLVHLHRLTHRDRQCSAIDAHALTPAAVSQVAMSGDCQACGEALAMFVDAYGSEAGNVALRTLPAAGLYVGGGIAPKILPALQDGRFMRAFRDKDPMQDLVARFPVKVILNQEAGLLGAAVAASRI